MPSQLPVFELESHKEPETAQNMLLMVLEKLDIIQFKQEKFERASLAERSEN